MIRIGNAPCSWGAFNSNQDIQYHQVLDEIQQTGFEGTDLGDWGFMPTDPLLLIDELKKRSLHLISGFVSVDFKNKEALSDGIARALQTARLLSAVEGNNSFLVLSDLIGNSPLRTQNAGRIRPEMGLLPFQWQNFASSVEQIALQVKGDHRHLVPCFTTIAVDSSKSSGEVGMLLDYTDPSLVGLCLDTGHYRFGGGDPLRLFKIFADRVQLVHFKDCDPVIADRSRREEWDYFKSVEQGVFCELGNGDVNFQAVKAELDKIHYQGWIVIEQDQMPGKGSPKESAQRNREYIRSIGY